MLLYYVHYILIRTTNSTYFVLTHRQIRIKLIDWIIMYKLRTTKWPASFHSSMAPIHMFRSLRIHDSICLFSMQYRFWIMNEYWLLSWFACDASDINFICRQFSVERYSLPLKKCILNNIIWKINSIMFSFHAAYPP